MKQLDLMTETSIRHQQAAAQAKLERGLLIREALADRRARFYQPALVSIGRQMVVWGMQLQHRYDDLYAAPEITLAAQPK